MKKRTKKDRKKRDIKFFMIGVLIWGVMTLGIFLAGGFNPVIDGPPTEVIPTSTTQPPPSVEPADDVENPATPGQVLPTLVPTPTPWIFPTPYWDNTDYKWPYGISQVAIPIEQTFDGPIKVYVLLGSDWMPHRDQDLTDTVMLVLVNTETHSATVVSVARDLYVFIPGFGWGRINQPWALGGFDTVKETIRYNFGLEVDGVVYGRIYAVQNFIDNGLGGISVYVNWPIVERCGDIEIDLLPGEVYMDGEYAVCYARARMMTDDDFRMHRQQEILLAMKTKFFANASENPAESAEILYDAYIESGIKTDISILDIPGLVWEVLEIQNNFSFRRIGESMLEHFDHPETGAWLWQMPTRGETYDFFIGLLAE